MLRCGSRADERDQGMIGQEEVRLRASHRPWQGWRPTALFRYRGSSFIVFGTTDAEDDAAYRPSWKRRTEGERDSGHTEQKRCASRGGSTLADRRARTLMGDAGEYFEEW
jgi:hypothetical protein